MMVFAQIAFVIFMPFYLFIAPFSGGLFLLLFHTAVEESDVESWLLIIVVSTILHIVMTMMCICSFHPLLDKRPQLAAAACIATWLLVANLWAFQNLRGGGGGGGENVGRGENADDGAQLLFEAIENLLVVQLLVQLASFFVNFIFEPNSQQHQRRDRLLLPPNGDGGLYIP